MIDRFGTLETVLCATGHELKEILAREPAVVRQLRLLRRADLHMRRRLVMSRPALGNWEALLDYLRAQQAHSGIEQVRVLFLNSRNMLIRDEVVSRGSIDQAPMYVREILKRSLELGAVAIIVVHNHPSGDPKPSRADIQTTQLLADAGRKLGVAVHDHLIVAASGHSSMRSIGIL